MAANTARKKPQYLNGRSSKYATGGSVAYDVGYTGAAVPRTRAPGEHVPRTLPRERVMVRPRAAVRAKGEVSLFSAVGVIALAVVAVMLLISYMDLLAVSEEVVLLRNEASALQTEQARLLAEYEVSVDLKAIEAAVTANGRMVKPQSEQIIYIDTYEPDSATFYADESAVKGAQGVLESFGRIWDNIQAYF